MESSIRASVTRMIFSHLDKTTLVSTNKHGFVITVDASPVHVVVSIPYSNAIESVTEGKAGAIFLGLFWRSSAEMHR